MAMTELHLGSTGLANDMFNCSVVNTNKVKITVYLGRLHKKLTRFYGDEHLNRVLHGHSAPPVSDVNTTSYAMSLPIGKAWEDIYIHRTLKINIKPLFSPNKKNLSLTLR